MAHRPSTVIDTDDNLVMDTGQVVKHGSHTELPALNGHYARIRALQQPDNPPLTARCDAV